MLDHLGIGVSNLARSKDFYSAALKPLGFGVVMEFPGVVGLGTKTKPFFWIGTNASQTPVQVHVAFLAANRAAVDAFYQAAIAAGGRDNGAPGLRPQYHANYYGAFVHDPDGYNVEAVCHLPAGTAAAKKAIKKVTARKKPAKKATKRRPAAKAKAKAKKRR